LLDLFIGRDAGSHSVAKVGQFNCGTMVELSHMVKCHIMDDLE